MNEGVPDSAAPAPIFLGDMNSLEEILEPKQDKIKILGFVVGFIVPPALFVIFIGLFFITGDWDLIILAIISGACVWPLAGIFLTIIAFKQEKKEQAIGALISLTIWIFILLFENLG